MHHKKQLKTNDLQNHLQFKPQKRKMSLYIIPRDSAAKSCQPCPTLCDPIDGGPPGSSIPGILQAGTLEWVAISFSNAWKWKVKVKLLNHVRLLVTPWTAAYRLLHPWDFPGKSTGVGCHCFLWKRDPKRRQKASCKIWPLSDSEIFSTFQASAHYPSTFNNFLHK